MLVPRRGNSTAGASRGTNLVSFDDEKILAADGNKSNCSRPKIRARSFVLFLQGAYGGAGISNIQYPVSSILSDCDLIVF